MFEKRFRCKITFELSEGYPADDHNRHHNIFNHIISVVPGHQARHRHTARLGTCRLDQLLFQRAGDSEYRVEYSLLVGNSMLAAI